MGLLMRRSVFDEVGGFDPDLGTAAPTPWQAGEATDLLLRMAERRPDLASGFAWLPSDVTVGGIADPSGLSRRERRRKLRASEETFFRFGRFSCALRAAARGVES